MEGQREGRHFRALMLKYVRIMILSLGIPLAILTGVIIYLMVSSVRSDFSMRAERALLSSSDYMDGAFARTQAAGTQATYERNLTDFFRLDRRILTMQMLDGLNQVQGYLRAMSGASDVVGSLLVVAYSPPYYIRSNSAWSRPDAMSAFAASRYPYAMLEAFEAGDKDWAWQMSGSDLCYIRAVVVRDRRVGCVFQRCNSVALSRAIAGDLQDSQRLLLVDGDGLILQDSSSRAAGQPLSQVYPALPASGQGEFNAGGTEAMALSVASGVQSWRYILVSGMAAVNGYARKVTLLGMALVIAILLMCTLIAYRFARVICKPYETILELLRTPVEDAREHYEVRYAARDELGMIYTLINQKRYQYLAIRSELTERERALKDAQHIALQAQMNPHFMFNALEAINWRVFEKLPEDREITGMIRDLSLLLRLSLETDEPIISVRREISHAQLYLKIQQRRLDTQLDVQWDIPEAMMGLTMLRLSLQPLFENAITYGVKMLDSGGRIRVEGRVEGDRMVIAVIDNGPGFDEVALGRIRRNLVDSRWKRSANIGLVNVNTRIQLLYGVEYGVRIESRPFEHTEVRIEMPVDGARKAEGSQA